MDIILPEIMDTSYVQSFLECLCAQEKNFSLDGRHVERVGGLCLQLMISARVTARARNMHFKINNPSEALKESLRLLGGEFLLGEEEKA